MQIIAGSIVYAPTVNKHITAIQNGEFHQFWIYYTNYVETNSTLHH